MLEEYFGERRFKTPTDAINHIGEIPHNDYRPYGIFIDNNQEYALARIRIHTLSYEEFLAKAISIYRFSKFRLIMYYNYDLKWTNLVQWNRKAVIFPLLEDWDTFRVHPDDLYDLLERKPLPL